MGKCKTGRSLRRTRRQRTRWRTQDRAWTEIRPSEGTLERTVLDAIAASPSTCDELEERLGLTHQTCSARVHTLMRRGLIVADGSRRTRPGRSARVWHAVIADGLFAIGGAA